MRGRHFHLDRNLIRSRPRGAIWSAFIRSARNLALGSSNPTAVDVSGLSPVRLVSLAELAPSLICRKNRATYETSGLAQRPQDVFSCVSRLAIVGKRHTSDISILAWWDSSCACVARMRDLLSNVRTEVEGKLHAVPGLETLCFGWIHNTREDWMQATTQLPSVYSWKASLEAVLDSKIGLLTCVMSAVNQTASIA